MALVITQTPTYPTPGKVRLTFTPSVGVNFIRAWITTAPLGTQLRTDIDATKDTRILVFESDGTGNFTFDAPKGGLYGFSIQEYDRGATAYGGGYSADPNSYQTETAIGSEQSLLVIVGLRLTMQLGLVGPAFGDSRTSLVLWIWEGTIRATNLRIHNEVTPSIIGAKTSHARAASESSAVVAALAGLVDQTAATLVGDVTARLDDALSNYNAHIVLGASHANVDTANPRDTSFANTVGVPAQLNSLSELLRALSSHQRNEDPAAEPSGTGSGNYHESGGSNVTTWQNMPEIIALGTPGDLLPGIAEYHRAYEAHRVDTDVHDAADSTNTLSTPDALMALHVAYMTALASTTPDSPTDNPGLVTLTHAAGMTES